MTASTIAFLDAMEKRDRAVVLHTRRTAFSRST